METPFEYHNDKLGVKISFLIIDRNAHPESLKLIKYITLHARIKKNQNLQLRRACFGVEALVAFGSLSQEWKDMLTIKFGDPKQEVKKSWFAQHSISDRKAFDFYVGYKYAEGKKLDLEMVEQYTYNASVLNTVLIMKENRKAYAKALGCTSIDIWDSLSRDVNAFREVAHNLPATKDTLRRKATIYAKEGYASLISGKLNNKSARKAKTEEQTALIDELIAKHTNLDNTQIANLYNMVAERLNWKTITSATVGNMRQESNLVTYAGRNGASALSNNILMQNRRSKPSLPMLYWTLDGWDAELLYQKTSANGKGHNITTYHNRLTMVVVLDPFNNYPVGFAIGTHENADLIKQALCNAVNHTKELFGEYYKPYQLQTDHYGKGALTPLYEACTKHYTPAKVKNAKAKVIEPYFSRINKEYCKMFDNWSGHNVNSGSSNQPNDEMLNKLRHTFPDELGCRRQLESIIIAERQKKIEAFTQKWNEVSEEMRLPMDIENYLLTFGASTGHTNRLQHNGMNVTINGRKIIYDSYDLNFRKLSHLDWTIKYDTHNLDKVLALSSDGKYRFMLEEKYVQPMALAERSESDAIELSKVQNFNKTAVDYIINQRQDNRQALEELFQKPQLSDTLAKHLLIDSSGQHKDQRNAERINITARTEKVLQKQEKAIKQEQDTNWRQVQTDYHTSKVNLNEYL